LSPNEGKRIGAALVFGKVYRALREEKVLISRYSLRIMYALYQGHRFGGQSQLEFSYTVNSYLSIIYKSIRNRGDEANLLHELPSRQYPKRLSDIVLFLWSNISHQDLAYRRLCMQGFTALALLLLENGSLEYLGLPFVNEFYPFELSIQDTHSTFVDNGLSCENVESFSLENFVKLRATLDSYNWLFKTGIIDAQRFFDLKLRKQSTDAKKRRKIESDNSSVSNFKSSNLLNLITSFLESVDNFVSTSESFDLAIAEVCRRILQLFSTLTESNRDYFVNLIKSSGLWDKISRLIIPLILQEGPFSSHVLSNSTTEKDEIEKYIPVAVFQFLKYLESFEPVGHFGTFGQLLRMRATDLLQNVTLLDASLLSRAGTLISFIIENSMSNLAFGEDYESFLRSVSSDIMQYILGQVDSSAEKAYHCKVLLETMLKFKCPLPLNDMHLIDSRQVLPFFEMYSDMFVVELIERTRLNSNFTDIKTLMFAFAENRDVLNMLAESIISNVQDIRVSDEHLAIEIVSILSTFKQLKVTVLRQLLNLSHRFVSKPTYDILSLSKSIISKLIDSKTSCESICECLQCLPFILSGATRQCPISTDENIDLQTEVNIFYLRP